MSSFICSKYHYQKVREMTNHFLKADKYARNIIGLNYNTSDSEVLGFIDKEIYNLIKNNIASVNMQYHTLDGDIKEYAKIFDKEPAETLYPYINTIEEMLSLYNAYDCIDYQIEPNYDKTFINNIRFALSKRIINYLQYNENSYNIPQNINKWEFKKENSDD